MLKTSMKCLYVRIVATVKGKMELENQSEGLLLWSLLSPASPHLVLGGRPSDGHEPRLGSEPHGGFCLDFFFDFQGKMWKL